MPDERGGKRHVDHERSDLPRRQRVLLVGTDFPPTWTVTVGRVPAAV